VATQLRAWACGLAGLAALASPACEARDWPETAGWEISEGDDFCLMHMEYEGPGDSSLAIGLYADGRIIIANVNYSWSAEKGRRYPEVSFELNGQRYTGTATGVDIVGKKGFAMKFGEEILADIAAASAVHVYKDDTLVDRLRLDGSAAALGVTKRCLASVPRNKRRPSVSADDGRTCPRIPSPRISRSLAKRSREVARVHGSRMMTIRLLPYVHMSRAPLRWT